jgi:hypothetical protein
VNWEAAGLLAGELRKFQADTIRQAAKTFSESEPEGSYASTPEQVIAWLNEYADGIEGVVE